jgi:plasmid replication initiation protein
MAFTYAELLACAERELRLRNKVYARWVDVGKMPERTAKREIELMEEIAAILRALDENQARLEYHDGRLPPTPGLPILLKVE